MHCDGLKVHGRAVEDKDIITIGVGDPNATSDKPDPRTLEIFSRNVQENTIRKCWCRCRADCQKIERCGVFLRHVHVCAHACARPLDTAACRAGVHGAKVGQMWLTPNPQASRFVVSTQYTLRTVPGCCQCRTNKVQGSAKQSAAGDRACHQQAEIVVLQAVPAC